MHEKFTHMLLDTGGEKVKLTFSEVLKLLGSHVLHFIVGNYVHSPELGGWNYGRGIIKPRHAPENLIPESAPPALAEPIASDFEVIDSRIYRA